MSLHVLYLMVFCEVNHFHTYNFSRFVIDGNACADSSSSSKLQFMYFALFLPLQYQGTHPFVRSWSMY